AGDPDAALASLARALTLNPRFVQAHHYRGILLGEAGDTNGAVAAFEETLRIDPGHARAWNNLGKMQRALGQLENAERSLVRAIAVRPDYPLRSEEHTSELQSLRHLVCRLQPGPPLFPYTTLFRS